MAAATASKSTSAHSSSSSNTSSGIRKVGIVGGLRIPFCRSGTFYNGMGNKELMSEVLKALVKKYRLAGQELGEVSLGAVLKHARDFNMARECTLESGLHPHTPAFDIQRACGTSLETAIAVGNKIALGQIEAGIAGGCDTNSEVPIEFSKKFSGRLLALSKAKTLTEKIKVFQGFSPQELMPVPPSINEPRTHLSMGASTEIMVKQWKISRESQDQLALKSHQSAAAAWKEGFYDDLVVPFALASKDNNVRDNTSLESLAKLKPSFDKSSEGTLTAGNSSPLTDGAGAVLLCSEEWAAQQGLTIEAYLTFPQSAAVDFVNYEGLLMAPAYAIPKMLQRAQLSLQDFDFYEIHEAFAGQVLCTLEALKSAKFCKEKFGLDKPLGEIDFSKLNVKGGSVALGHPFGATGARIVATLTKLLKQKGKGRGLISLCTAGGMGVTAILERP